MINELYAVFVSAMIAFSTEVNIGSASKGKTTEGNAPAAIYFTVKLKRVSS